MTRIDVHVTPMRGGARRVELVCTCGRTGRLALAWEADVAVVAGLLDQYRKASPRCPHPDPVIGAAT
ncbi:hypothetical protein BH23CHL8_BH23CHL8_31500 [soil metagenome]